MKGLFTAILVFCVLAVALSSAPVALSEKEKDSNSDEGYNPDFSKGSIFEPEDDWKEILPDQHLPGVSISQFISLSRLIYASSNRDWTFE